MFRFHGGICVSVICAFLFISSNSQGTDDDWLKPYLEELKVILKNGSESMGIPKLDPFFFNETFAFVQPPKVDSYVHIEGSVANFSNFVIYDAKLDRNLSSYFVLMFTNPVLNARFTINGTAMTVIPLDSDGDLELEFNNLGVLLQSRIVGFEKILQIEDLMFVYTLSKAELNIEGLLREYGFTYTLRDVIADVALPLLKRYHSDIEAAINNAIPTLGNQQLRQIGPRTIIEMLKGKFVK